MPDEVTSTLHIKLFHSFEVLLSDRPVTRFEADSARALLAYLATRPGTAVARDVLAQLLWNAEDGANALTNLRSALRRVRGAVEVANGDSQPVDYLVADRSTVMLNPAAPIWVDVVEFERLLELVRRHLHASVVECATCCERLQQATALYRGEFLADILVDTVRFEEWRRAESERLQRMALHALYVLGERAYRTDSFAEAEQLARRQLALEGWNEEAHRQLMRILFASGRRTAALTQYDLCRRTLAEELGIDPDEETETLYLRLLAGESPAPRMVGSSPYKGLSPFGPEDTEVFFGRAAVAARLRTAVVSQSAIVLIGPSGSGKSSVLNAGLIPLLHRQLRRGDSNGPARQEEALDWQVSTMRPGPDPLAALDEALSANQAGTARRLLVVDQFEELFTLCHDSNVRTAYMERLLSANGASLPPATAVLIAMRSDFLSDALNYSALTDLIQNHTIVLGPLSRTELQRVIEEPARLRGVAFEPGLVERLLHDIGDSPGQLPLLQFALAQLWDRQSDGWITHAAFDAIGGVRGALAGYADQIFDSLTADEQAQAQQVFLTLVQPTADAQDVRRMATRAEIGEQGWPLVQRLANDRLLVTNRNAKGEEIAELVHEALIREWGELQAWLAEDREFQTWKQRTRAVMVVEAASQFDETTALQGARLLEAKRWLAERGADIDDPLRAFIAVSVAADERLRQAEEAARQRELANAQALAEAEHRRAESEARGRRRLIWLSTGLVLLVVIAFLAALLAYNAQQTAEAERKRAEGNARIALARQLGAQAINAQETQIDLALLLNQESLRLNTSARDNAELLLKTAVDPRLRKIMYGVDGAIYGERLQADGESVLAHNEFGNVLLWDGETGQQSTMLPSTDTEPQGVVLSPQGGRMATWRNGVITVRDAETTDPLYELTSPAGVGLYTIAISTDGSRIVSYWEDGKFRLWDARSGALLDEYAVDLAERDLLTVASPDGHIVLLAGEKDNKPLLYLWDITTDQAAATLPQNHTDSIHQATVSPDGSLLATASVDGSVRLWDAKTGEQRGEPLLGHKARVLFAAFSPDGKTLVSGGTDDQVILWDVASGKQIGRPLLGHSNWVRTGVFSRDGTKLITGDNDGRVLIWDLGMNHELRGHDDRVRAALFSPDENTLVTAGFDKQLIIRDAKTFTIERQVATEHQNAILNAAYSPNGETFATVDAGGMLILWDTATWTARHVLTSTVQDQLVGLAFSPDSKLVATGAFNGIVDVRNAATGESVVEPFPAHSNGWAMCLLFSPDGQRLYSGSSDQTIRIWDTAAYTSIGEPLRGHTNRVNDLTLSPDGKTLVSADSDETIRTWDAVTGEPVGEPLLGHQSPVWNVSFRTVGNRLALVSLGGDGTIIWWDWETRTPLRPPLRTNQETEWMRLSADGRRILISFMDSVVRVIDVDPASWAARACQIANRNLTEAEWAYYLPDLPYKATCFSDSN